MGKVLGTGARGCSRGAWRTECEQLESAGGATRSSRSGVRLLACGMSICHCGSLALLRQPQLVLGLRPRLALFASKHTPWKFKGAPREGARRWWRDSVLYSVVLSRTQEAVQVWRFSWANYHIVPTGLTGTRSYPPVPLPCLSTRLIPGLWRGSHFGDTNPH